MRLNALTQNPTRAARVARLALVSGIAVGLVTLFSCTQADNNITGPLKTANTTEVEAGFNHAGRVLLCVDSTSPAGVYKFTNSGFLSIYNLDGSIDGANGGDGATVENVNDGVEYQVAVGACQEVIARLAATTEHEVNNAADVRSGVNITATTIPAYATYSHTDCLVDTPQSDIPTPYVFPNPCDTANNPTRAYANIHHGVVIRFTFEPRVIPVPQFVIGDVEAHGVGDIVSFWDSQWWKNNQMSQFTSPGYPSFKGFADTSDNFCGGTWTSLPGNSSKPPKTIDNQVAVIVTNNVVKNGANIGGRITQIVLVQQDNKYGPNPGHAGGGRVTEVLCSLPN